jgi:hypothetical protein
MTKRLTPDVSATRQRWHEGESFLRDPVTDTTQPDAASADSSSSIALDAGTVVVNRNFGTQTPRGI